MKFGKRKPPAPTGRQVSRTPGAGQGQRTAFSYYASNRTPTPEPRRQGSPNAADPSEQRQPGRLAMPVAVRRPSRSQWPLGLLLLVLLVCAVRLLVLSTSAKVILLGQTPATQAYTRPLSTYQQAASKLLASTPLNRTKLSVQTAAVASQLKREFPEFQDVSVTLPLVGTRPLVYAQLSSPDLLLQDGQHYFAVNQNGVVLAALHSPPNSSQVVVHDQSGTQPTPGKQALPASYVQFMAIVVYELKAGGFTVSSFTLPAASPFEIDAQLQGSPLTLRFNQQADARLQSGAVAGTLKQIGITTPEQYVDVRTPQRVYYK